MFFIQQLICIFFRSNDRTLVMCDDGAVYSTAKRSNKPHCM
jgi:hypothetical protein